MRSFTTLDLEQHFRFDLGPNDHNCEMALYGANMAIFMVLQSVIDYLRLTDVDADMNTVFDHMKASAKTPFEGAP